MRLETIFCMTLACLALAGCAGPSANQSAPGTVQASANRGESAVSGFAERMGNATSIEAADQVAAEFTAATAGNGPAALEELKTLAVEDPSVRAGALALLSRNLRASDYGRVLMQISQDD